MNSGKESIANAEFGMRDQSVPFRGTPSARFPCGIHNEAISFAIEILTGIGNLIRGTAAK